MRDKQRSELLTSKCCCNAGAWWWRVTYILSSNVKRASTWSPRRSTYISI